MVRDLIRLDADGGIDLIEISLLVCGHGRTWDLAIGGRSMPLRAFMEQERVSSDLTPILTEAFDTAWARLEASGTPFVGEECAPATRALLAKRIIETALKGEKDVNRLIEDGLGYLSELK